MKRVLLVSLCVLLLVSLCACNGSIQEDWKKVLMGDKIPCPEKGKLKISSNDSENFWGTIENVDEDFYLQYKKDCIAMGYSVDASDSLIGYIAYNPDAYKINLSFAGSRLSISLDAPLELNPITWPTSGVGALLPVPESLLAKVTENTSDSYRVVIGNSSLQVFNSYVSLCQDNGFNVDYYSKDNKYEAKNSEGFRLNVAYLGCNQMEIMILSPKEDSSVVVSSSKNNSSSEKPNNSIFSKEFKEAMDSYEAFMDEYVSFMKKYKNSNGTDTTLITDYANYMTCYTQVVSDFSKWRSEELNTEEAKYYIEVQARVAQKLLDVAS